MYFGAKISNLQVQNILNMKKFLFLAAGLLAATLSWGQQMPEQLPIDPSIRTGKLENGLTYFIRHNEKPADRAEFYLATNVGAIQETPDQDGLAHFLEHMCFNGTKNFPEKGILNWLESIGASFGGNVNASTGVEQTIYLLNNIPLIRPTVVDTCLLIMHDYSHFVTCDPVEIDKERGVILEEKRSRDNAGWRINVATKPYLFGDSKYAGCTIIGSEENLKTFRPESLTNFYKTWYRPDMQALIVVGDIDVDEVEAKIKSTFADIPAAVDPKQKDVHVIPANKEPIIGIITDPEANSLEYELIWKRERLPEILANTQVGIVMDLCNSIIRKITAERLHDIASSASSPFVSASAFSGKICETSDIFDLNASFDNGNDAKTLETLLIEAKKLKLYGISDSELERAKSDLISYYESKAKSAATRSNSEFVMPIISHFFDNQTLLDPETELQLVQMILPNITADVINQLIPQVITDENLVVLYSGPSSAKTPTEKEVLDIIAKVSELQVESNSGEEIPSELLDKSRLKGSKIKKSRPYIYESTLLTLGNGMKVILATSNKDQDRIIIDVFKRGGRTLIDDSDIASFEDNIWAQFNHCSGVSDFSLSTLKKMLAGKKVSASPYINELTHGISAESGRKDFETAMQLVYLTFTDPRFDQDEYNQAIKQIQAVLPNLKTNPNYALQDHFYKAAFGNGRRTLINDETLANASLETLERVYRSMFNDAAGAVAIICGDFDLEEGKALAAKYLGSIPKGKKASEIIDRNDWFVDGEHIDDFKTAMNTPKVTDIRFYKINREYSYALETNADALAYILNMLYTETLREDQGGTYGASVYANTNREPFSGSVLNVAFETNPEAADKLRALVDEGLRGIAENGPSPEMFEKTIKNMEKSIPEQMEKISNWSSWIREYTLFGSDHIAEYEKAVKELTPETIKATALEFLSSGNRVEVVMRPE